MTTTYCAAFSAALAVFCASGQAAPKPKDNSPTTQARNMIEQMDVLSDSIRNTGDRLATTAKGPEDPEGQLERLDTIKEDVNKIGRELRLLQAEQGSLAEWQGQTIDEVLPLMREIAANTDQAIQTYNSNRNHLWATSFPEETARIFENAKRATELLDGQLKLAAVREQEQRLETKVESEP
jgi:hypothetical protein